MSRISKQSWEEIDYLYSRSNLEKEQFRKMTWGFQNLVFNSQLKLFIKMFCCSKTFERVEAEAWNKNKRFISFHFVKKMILANARKRYIESFWIQDFLFFYFSIYILLYKILQIPFYSHFFTARVLYQESVFWSPI